MLPPRQMLLCGRKRVPLRVQRGNEARQALRQLLPGAECRQFAAQRMQQELQTREFTATVGGGAVRATAYGSKVIKSIEIDPACVDPDDVEMLQDLVLSAVNEAMRMAEEATNSEVSKLTGGMGLGF